MEKIIEAVLFYRNEPVKISELCKILDKKEEEVREGLEKLKNNLENRGITLMENGSEFSLATSGEVSGVIEKIAKEELNKDLGKASLETLAIILYNGPISRREIDYIRGVNSTFILRSLMVRGLIEREQEGSKGFIYKPTIEILGYLGLESKESLPEFEKIKKEIELINDNARE